MKIAYISENKMYLYADGKVSELPSERAAHYTETVNTIRKNKEWKNSGTGAHFTGAVYEDGRSENQSISINGLAWDGKGLIYSMVLGGMGAVYRKNIDEPDAAEEHILTSMDTYIGGISLKNDKLAVVMDGHIAVSDMNGCFNELTDGDSAESSPFWSKNENRIICSSRGIARNERGNPADYGSSGIISLDLTSNSIDELTSDDSNDFLNPKTDPEGCMYCIRQPYKAVQEKKPLWKDILLFPIRIIKAIVGFLNAFSVIFGGEPLRDGKSLRDVKDKKKSERDLFFEGRLIEAEKNEKENASKGEKNPGIFPRSRVLVKLGDDGEKVIKHGVQDYILLDDGSLVCSNGRALIHITDSGEEVLAKAKMAHCLCEITEVHNEG